MFSVDNKQMDVIEFLQTTEHKNINNYIGKKVKEKLKEYEKALNERRYMLREILQVEGIQYEDELLLLLNERLEEQFRKRLEWINTKKLERTKAEEELLKLKNQQRELENCEKWRHMQSKQLLLETKEAQLYQIAEKKLRIEKEKEIEKQWLDMMDRLNQEREYQEIYENKLRKVIAGWNQQKNQEIHQNSKMRQQFERKQHQKDEQDQSQKLLSIDEEYHKEQKLKEILNRTQQHESLKNQIASNCRRRNFELQKSLEEGKLLKDLVDQELHMNLAEAKRQKIRNKVWQKHYLKACLEEKQQKAQKELEFEKLYLSSGCVLQETPKRPYGKNAR